MKTIIVVFSLFCSSTAYCVEGWVWHIIIKSPHNYDMEYTYQATNAPLILSKPSNCYIDLNPATINKDGLTSQVSFIVCHVKGVGMAIQGYRNSAGYGNLGILDLFDSKGNADYTIILQAE